MDVQKGRSKVVTLVPDSPMASPVAAIYGLDGADTGVSVSASASSFSSTVASSPTTPNTRSSIQLDSVSGLLPGASVLVTDDQFGTAQSVVSAVDASAKVMRLVDALPAAPASGATVEGLDVTATIPTEATSALGLGYILEVTGTGAEPVRLEFNVVRFPFIGPCKAHHVRAKLARGYPGELSKDEVLHQRIADTVNAQIRARLMTSARYVSAYWNPETLEPVRAPMLLLVLAEQYGIREAGSTRDDYLSAARLEVTDRLGAVLSSRQPIDSDMSGAIDVEEQRGDIGSEWVR